MSALPNDKSPGHHPRLSVRLEVISANLLDVDPDVQHAFALQESRWRRIGATWDTRKQGVLEVTPQQRDSGRFFVIDGRHRLLGGRDVAGVKEFRCNVHRPSLPVSEKASVKLGLDRDRRRVSALESFFVEVTMGDPTAIAIKKTVERSGFSVGPQPGGRRTDVGNKIAAVGALRTIQSNGLLSRVLALNSIWMGEARSNTSDWLLALMLFCREGFDLELTDANRRRLEEIVPGKIWKKAIGKLTTTWARSVGGDVREVSRLMAEEIRRSSGVRRRTR